MMRAVVAMCSQSLRCSQCIPPCVAKHSSDLPTLSSRPQFPNLNKLITREIFAELTSEATCETSGIPLAILRQAALQVFDERLDTIGSGMVSVRQILSFYRHGFLEAAGQPHEVSGEHFARASTPYREMARVYDDAEPISPRRFPTSREPSRSRPRIPLAHGTKHSLSGSTGLSPAESDQPFWAAACYRAGVSPNAGLPASRLGSGEKLGRALKQSRSDRGLFERAERLSVGMRSEGGAAAAARVVVQAAEAASARARAAGHILGMPHGDMPREDMATYANAL